MIMNFVSVSSLINDASTIKVTNKYSFLAFSEVLRFVENEKDRGVLIGNICDVREIISYFGLKKVSDRKNSLHNFINSRLYLADIARHSKESKNGSDGELLVHSREFAKFVDLVSKFDDYAELTK